LAGKKSGQEKPLGNSKAVGGQTVDAAEQMPTDPASRLKKKKLV